MSSRNSRVCRGALDVWSSVTEFMSQEGILQKHNESSILFVPMCGPSLWMWIFWSRLKRVTDSSFFANHGFNVMSHSGAAATCRTEFNILSVIMSNVKKIHYHRSEVPAGGKNMPVFFIL